MKLPPVAEVRKTLIAAAGVLAQLVALGLLHGPVLHWAQVTLTVLTAAGVYQVPNRPRTPKA